MDITMCRDLKCPMKFSCYRHTAPWNQFKQSIFTESPRNGDKCDMHLDNEGRRLDVKFKEYESWT